MYIRLWERQRQRRGKEKKLSILQRRGSKKIIWDLANLEGKETTTSKTKTHLPTSLASLPVPAQEHAAYLGRRKQSRTFQSSRHLRAHETPQINEVGWGVSVKGGNLGARVWSSRLPVDTQTHRTQVPISPRLL